MMKKDYKGKKVLVRVDVDFPLEQNYNITDESRIVAALPTIRHLIDDNEAVILMSHLGRPQKQKKEDGSINTEKFTLSHLVNHLSELLDQPVDFAHDVVGEQAKRKTAELPAGQEIGRASCRERV